MLTSYQTRAACRSRLGCASAFTLVETMVSFGILSILLGLLLPAVQASREASRSVQCLNSLKQLSLALTSFHAIHSSLPSNGGWSEGNAFTAGGVPVVLSTFALSNGQLYKWGSPVPGQDPRTQNGSWAHAILKELNVDEVYQLGYSDSPISMFLCASRHRDTPAPPSSDSYGTYEGGGVPWPKADYAGNAFVFPERPRRWKIEHITDGASHTILLGEKAHDPLINVATSWYWDEPLTVGGSSGTTREGHQIITDGPGISFKRNWGSAHTGGRCHFSRADGSVHTVTNQIDWKLFLALRTPNQKEVVND